jgi:O-antigen ligase
MLFKVNNMVGKTARTVFGLDTTRPGSVLYLLLLALLFSISITTGTWDLGNSHVVMHHELVFVLACAVALGAKPFVALAKASPIVSVLMIAWLLSITVSLLLSPYNLAYLSIGRARYFETILHILFFLSLLAYFRLYQPPLRYIFYMLLFSNAFVVIQAISVWHFSPEVGIHTSGAWFSRFPFVGHARHAGYNMLVAVLSGIFLLLSESQLRQRICISLAFFLVTVCLFWLGGRGSMLSAVFALGLVLVWVRRRVVIDRKLLFLTLGVVMLALLAAHFAAAFGWNGVWNSIGRSVAAESANRLSSGRLTIWLYSLDAIRNDWFLGLGSQSYLFIPGKWRSTAMPHNAIVQFLVEWGVLGATLFLSLFVYGLRQAFVRLRDATLTLNAEVLGAMTIVVALAFHGLTDGTFYHGKASFYMALCFALCLGGVFARDKCDENCQLVSPRG